MERIEPWVALARLSALLEEGSELAGDAPLSSLLDCARAAAGAASASLAFSTPRSGGARLARSAGSVEIAVATGGTRGSLVLRLEAVDDLSAGQVQVLLLCSALIGSVLRTTEKRTEHEAREARRAAVHAVAVAAMQHQQLDDMLAAAVEAMRLGVRCDGVRIQTFDSPTPTLERSHSAIYPSWAGSLATNKLLDVSARAAHVCWDEHRASLLSLDDLDIVPLTTAAERDYMFDFMRSIGAQSLLMAPMGGGGTCLGYIALTRITPEDPFDAEDEAAVLTIGRELGNVVAHSRLIEQQRLMLGELTELHNYKDNFVATVAHQLKSPLTSVIGHTELLEDAATDGSDVLAQQGRISLPTIAKASGRILETIEGLLTLSKVQLAHRDLIAGEVPMSELVRDCVDLLTVVASERGVILDTSQLTADAHVWGDRSEIEKVVDNLLSNAVKYSRPGGTVSVATSCSEGGVVLRCRDDGAGMSNADVRRLYEPFHRSTDPRTSEQPGTGLGMTIVKAVVDRHGGRIDVSSQLGTGTTFVVWLPSPPAREHVQAQAS